MAFIKVDKIELEAQHLLYNYGINVEAITTPPIPVAEIFECYLDFSLEFSNLQAKYGDNKVLAEIYILSKKVIVDQSLDPDVYPQAEGRFNFTLAYEIGHWILHREDVIAVADTPDLFGEVPPPAICRDFSIEPHEWQANQFAAYLLMPKDFVFAEWNKFNPNGSLNVYNEIKDKRQRFHIDNDKADPICDIVRQLAPIFKVSLQAMQIRLKGMNLLDFNIPCQTLFN